MRRRNRPHLPLSAPQFSVAGSGALRQPRLWLLAVALALVAAVSALLVIPVNFAAGQGQAANDFVPANFRASILNSGVRFTWAAPGSGGTVRNYQIRHDTDSDLDNGATEATVAGDANRLRYDVREGRGVQVWAQVRAQASDGNWGPWSHLLTATGNRPEARQAPDRPAALAVTAGYEQLTVDWTEPNINGCSIIRYWVQHRRAGTTGWSENRNAWKIDDGGDLSHTITGLANGTSYEVQVRADGLCGRGDWSSSGSGLPVAEGASGAAVIATDYDSDDDGLIEVDSLAQLNAIRWDMNGDGVVDDSANNASYAQAFPNPVPGMGCPATGCEGYELEVNLNFNHPSHHPSHSVYHNGGKGWVPIGGLEIGGADAGFNATFDGNGNTISNLFINREYSSSDYYAGYRVGLFGVATRNSVIRNLNLASVSVHGDEEVGALIGLTFGQVENVSVTGRVSGDTIDVGGLVGILRGSILSSSFDGTVSGTAKHTGGLVGTVSDGSVRHSSTSGTVTTSGNRTSRVGGLAGSNSGIISSSYSTSNVTADTYWVGGLVGENGGPYAKNGGAIVASYSRGDVSGEGDVGGLVGENYARILISYSTSAVHRDGSEPVGGLVGRQSLNDKDPTVYYSVTESYWTTDTTAWSFGVGSDDRNNNNSVDEGETNTVPGYSLSDLRSPTGYTGLYQTWDDYDQDGNAGTNRPWCFGTSSDLPTLKDAAGNCP